MKISVIMHDTLQIKERIHEGITELYHLSFFSVRINYCMHLHRPDHDKIAFHQIVGILVHPENIGFSGTHQNNLSIGMPMHLIAALLIACGHIKSAHIVKIIYLVSAVIHENVLSEKSGDGS